MSSFSFDFHLEMTFDVDDGHVRADTDSQTDQNIVVKPRHSYSDLKSIPKKLLTNT